MANGRYFGGGMRVAPDALLDDGLFDVIVVSAMGRFRSITSMPSLYRGTHVRRRGVEVHRASRVGIEHVDRPLLFDVEGEQIGRTPATIHCVPGAISLCAPPSVAGR
ncbi:MAG: hypothetical protein ABR498_07380 [Candidatus Dormibacteria bacterium]